MKLEGSILGLVTKIPPAFYAKSIESQINVLKNSNLEAIYGKQLMEDVNAENKILLEDLAARSDTRIVECENNIRQAIIESNNDFKRQIAKVKGEFMRKFEELEAIIKGSAKQNPNVRSEHEELDVFSRVFCTSEIIDSDIINPTQDYSIGTVTRETQTAPYWPLLHKVYGNVVEFESFIKDSKILPSTVIKKGRGRNGIGLKSRVLEQIQDGGILSADFDELGRKMSSYLLQSRSDNTNNKYFYAYKRWERFILKQGGLSLPAKPIYVALYLTILIDKCSSYSVVQSAYSSLRLNALLCVCYYCSVVKTHCE
ncbi:unnamed protein product [Mytilus edulis]|uniref:Uncharacterized protein n=1 Tax=Mytilus edulis TaxID=6550 RepID=A0A8S3SZX2_MYTED|nr:unnamed protein product [Mytilus edulis]